MDSAQRREWLLGQIEAMDLDDALAEIVTEWSGDHLALYTEPTVDGEPIPVLDFGHAAVKLRLPAFAKLRSRLREAGFDYREEPFPQEVLHQYPQRRRDSIS